MAQLKTVFQLFKGWDKFAAATDPWKFKMAMDVKFRGATIENSKDVKHEIRRRIDGQEFAKNAHLTILLKGSSKPLVGGTTGYGGSDVGGTMLKSLDYNLLGHYTAVIGVKRNRAGHNVALIVHQGAVLKMTPKRHKWLEVNIGKALGKPKSGVGWNAIVIPSRPFIIKAMQDPALQKRLIDRWARAGAEALKVK